MNPRYDGMHPMMGTDCGCGGPVPPMHPVGAALPPTIDSSEGSNKNLMRLMIFGGGFLLIGGVIFLKATNRL